MPGLAAPTAPILLKSSGNVQSDVNKLRTLRTPESQATASGLDDLQRQVNVIVQALTNPGALTDLLVLNTKGAMIGWIGSRIVDGITYEGGWFENIYIGGTGPADAVITASGGGVVINNASIKLTSNGLETDINNETLPAFGSGVSLVSIDTSVPNGDQSFIAPSAMGTTSWDGAAFQTIAILGDDGSQNGVLQLTGVGSSDQIFLQLNPPVITVSNGVSGTIIGPTEINTPLINADGYQVSSVPGIDLVTDVLTAAAISSGTINYGVSLTVNTSGTGVFGTPGVGQSNGTVVTGVSLNLSGVVNVVNSASVTTVNHHWAKGILTV